MSSLITCKVSPSAAEVLKDIRYSEAHGEVGTIVGLSGGRVRSSSPTLWEFA